MSVKQNLNVEQPRSVLEVRAKSIPKTAINFGHSLADFTGDRTTSSIKIIQMGQLALIIGIIGTDDISGGNASMLTTNHGFRFANGDGYLIFPTVMDTDASPSGQEDYTARWIKQTTQTLIQIEVRKHADSGAGATDITDHDAYSIGFLAIGVIEQFG